MQGGGAEKPEIFDDWRKRGRAKVKKPTIATIVFVIATVALAAISISLLGLAEHYNDSRNRSQYWLVKSLSESISGTTYVMEGALDPDLEAYESLALAVSTYCKLSEAYAIAHSIQLMYPDDSLESETFMAVQLAMRQTQRVIENVENRISWAIEGNYSWVANSTITSSISNASALMSDLSSAIYAGIDSSQDFLEDPYSVVSRMDLASVKDISKDIEETMIELMSWI